MSEKQRLKRNAKKTVEKKQYLQIKVSRRKISRKKIAEVAFKEGAFRMFNKVETWLKLEYPKGWEKKWKSFQKFMGTDKLG